MASNIGSDLNRFKDVIKRNVKENLGKIVGNEEMIAQQGGKIVKIPLKFIDVPRFRFGSKDQGGASQGDGDIGDGVGNGKKKPGKGDKAGDEGEEHEFSAEFTPDELAEMMIETLNLPDLEPKDNGKVDSEKTKYNKISNVGNESLRHNRRTFKEALKRGISSGDYNPYEPKIVPIRADKRYRTSSITEKPDVNAVIINIIDCSGSMGDTERKLAQSIAFWIDLILGKTYKNIQTVYIAHDTRAQECTKEQFYSISSGGGTHISSGYKMCMEMIEKKYPYANNNIYIFQFTDSDNSGMDDEPALTTLTEILNNCNKFSYVNVGEGNGGFAEKLNIFDANDKLNVSFAKNNEHIMKTIKTIFE